MWTDPHLVERMVANVVSNARKHTPEGTRVVLSARSVGESVELSMADDGPGIPADLRASVFDRFTRGDESRDGKEGSTGQGMSIIQGIASTLGAEVSLESAEGEGTTVTIRIPRGLNV